MIFDNIANAEKYYACHPKFEAAFAFIRKVISDNLPADRYHLGGAEMYAFVQEYETRLPTESMFEGHKNYIDIQCIVSGTEVMESVDLSLAEEKIAYDTDKDVGFFEDHPKALRAVFGSGDFAVFFPHDIHKPGMGLDGVTAPARKIVVKVHV